MSRMIISKKGKMPTGFVALSALAILVAVFFFFTLPKGLDFDGDEAIMSLITFATPFLFLILGVYGIASGMRYSSSYINIYDDHIEGYGVLGKTGNRGQNFNFNNSVKYTANLEGSYLSINCNNISYYIYLPLPDAQQVYNTLLNPGSSSASAYTSYSGTAPKSAYESSATRHTENAAYIVCTCPGCSAKCRIGARIGKSLVTCPKCGRKFYCEYYG